MSAGDNTSCICSDTICKGLALSFNYQSCRVPIDSPQTFLTMPTIHATHTATPLTSLNLHASTVQSGGQTVTINISYSVPQQNATSCGAYPLTLLDLCAFN